MRCSDAFHSFARSLTLTDLSGRTSIGPLNGPNVAFLGGDHHPLQDYSTISGSMGSVSQASWPGRRYEFAHTQLNGDIVMWGGFGRNKNVPIGSDKLFPSL